MDKFLIADDALLARWRFDAVEWGVAGDDIVELGLGVWVVTVDDGDGNVLFFLPFLLGVSVIDVVVSPFFTFDRRLIGCGDSWQRFGDVVVFVAAGDFVDDDFLLEWDFLVDDEDLWFDVDAEACCFAFNFFMFWHRIEIMRASRWIWKEMSVCWYGGRMHIGLAILKSDLRHKDYGSVF